VDTFKVVSKVAQLKTALYGHASLSELDTLEYRLQNGERIHALVVELPQNPLLGSPDLLRIRQLSNRYDFIVICDDTVATAVNVDVLQFADIIVHSLSKMFSGGCNVMGGSIIFNPRSAHIADLRKILENDFMDTYFPPDAAIMEFNSRDFVHRVTTATQNAEIIVDLLRQHECVQEVYYPKGSKTQHFYDVCKKSSGKYSYLLSIIFKKPEQAVAFYDALNVEKGPSLGTNFTLSCPYTLLAHYWEMEWAKEFGVGEFLIRISIGLEEAEVLKGKVEVALDAALRAGG
jgi:cystathionine gamma-synthase